MKTLRHGAAAILALLAASCTIDIAGQTMKMAPARETLDELPPQELNAGQCALFLWAQGSPPLRFLATFDKPAVARIEVEGRTVELPRVAQAGQPVYGQFPEQHYRGSGRSLDISFTADTARGLSGGAVVPSAVVKYIGTDGWETVVPGAGLIACQS